MEKEEIYENNELSDQNKSVIMEESKLYFSDKEKYNYGIDGNVILLKNLYCEHNICLRGDNLITRK